jgi:hypothetical protein
VDLQKCALLLWGLVVLLGLAGLVGLRMPFAAPYGVAYVVLGCWAAIVFIVWPLLLSRRRVAVAHVAVGAATLIAVIILMARQP